MKKTTWCRSKWRKIYLEWGEFDPRMSKLTFPIQNEFGATFSCTMDSFSLLVRNALYLIYQTYNSTSGACPINCKMKNGQKLQNLYREEKVSKCIFSVSFYPFLMIFSLKKS
jgi:hypothetical protein